MLRVVADSNIFISAFVFGGKPLRILTLATGGEVQALISEAIAAEIVRVLGLKFAWTEERLTRARHQIEVIATFVQPSVRLSVIREDPDDDRVLECALEARAEVIVSGDRDLLRLGEWRGIRVMRPADLLALMDSMTGEG